MSAKTKALSIDSENWEAEMAPKWQEIADRLEDSGTVVSYSERRLDMDAF